jgi:hypothetical protein
MVNGIILEMMEAMTLQEFQQWVEETGGGGVFGRRL